MYLLKTTDSSTDYMASRAKQVLGKGFVYS